jgi:ribonuclease Z
MRHLLEPRLVNDVFGDPGLHVDFRDERRALLFDLGDIAALPPRKLMRLTQVFVTHTHMDHFAGFDALLRVLLGRKESLTLVGGPDFIAQVEHKLHAYTWNVVHRYEVELVLDVRELGVDGRGRRAPDGDVLHDDASCRVRARFVDHGMPCLAYAVEEKTQLKIARDRLAAHGLATGAWLRELKQAVQQRAPDDTPIRLQWRDRGGEHHATRPLGVLRDIVLDLAPGRRVGYVTDLRHTDANLSALSQLLDGVDLLFIEAVFLDADAHHAARKNHLTARQAGAIARRVGARRVQPFHFSPRYQGRADELADEVQAAWSGTLAAPPATPD